MSRYPVLIMSVIKINSVCIQVVVQRETFGYVSAVISVSIIVVSLFDHCCGVDITPVLFSLFFVVAARSCLSALSSNSPSEKNVLRHDSDSVGVNRTVVGVFKERHEVGLGGHLECEDGRALETKVVP